MSNRLSGSFFAILATFATTFAFAAGGEHTYNVDRQPISLTVPDGWSTSFHMMGRQLIILGPLHDAHSQVTIGVERLPGPAPKKKETHQEREINGKKVTERDYFFSCKKKKDVTFHLKLFVPQAAAGDADTATGIVKSFTCR